MFEPVYRIERLLYQLKLSGVLDSQRAIVLGEFSGYRGDEYDPAYDLQGVVQHLRSMAARAGDQRPAVRPSPRQADPAGRPRARLQVAADGQAELAFSGYPHMAAAHPAPAGAA